MRKAQIIWKKRENQVDKQPIWKHLLQWCIWILLLELLWVSNGWILQDVFEGLTLDKWDGMKLTVWITVVVVMQEMLQLAIMRDGERAKIWRFFRFLWITSVILVLVFLYFRNRDGIWDGMLAIGDQYVEAINYYYKLGLLKPGGNKQYISQGILFWCLPTVFVSYGLARSCRRRWILFAPTLLIVVAELIIGFGPQWKSVLLFLAVAGMFAIGRWNEGGIRKGDVWSYGVLGVLFCVLAIGSTVFGEEITAPFMAKVPEFKVFQANMERRITNFSVVDLFSDDNSVNNRTPEYEDRKVLKITLQGERGPVEDLYVQTGYGLHYKGGTWTRDEKELQERANEAGYDEKELEGLVRELREGNGNNPNRDYEHIKVEALDAVGRLHLEQLQKKGLFSMQFGQGHQLYSLFTRKQEMVIGPDILTAIQEPEKYPLWNWYAAYLKEEIKGNYQADAIVEKQCQRAMVEKQEYLGNYYFRDGWNEIEAGLSEAEWMQELYYINYETDRLAAEIGDLIQWECKYQLYLDRIPEDRDPIEYFLNESHQGYCVHFASAATLLLQKLGVPSRYCTGYIVKKEAFSEEAEGVYSAEVEDRNAHAWVEIFYPGVGWVPYEMTPGYEYMRTLPTEEDSMKELLEKKQQSQEQDEVGQADVNTGEQKQTDQADEKRDDSQQEEDSEKDSEQKNGYLNYKLKDKEQNSNSMKDNLQNGTVNGYEAEKQLFRDFRALVAVFGFVLIITLIGGIPAFFRHRRRLQETMLWEKKRYRKYVRWVNCQIYCKLRRKGLIRRKLATDKEIKEKLDKLSEELLFGEAERYMTIVQKASFGSEGITEEEAAFCRAVYKKACNR